jgi:hypothetical protein
MLYFLVFVKRIARSPAVPSPSRIPILPPLSPKSHGINFFADPHPLTPVASIFYKNSGWQGAPPPIPRPPRPIHQFTLSTEKQRKCPNSAQFWCNLSPLDATLLSLLLCVANKELAQYLSPLNATLTKNTGGTAHANQIPDNGICPEEHRGEGSLLLFVAQPFLAVLLHQSPVTNHESSFSFDFQLSTSYRSGRTVAFPLHSTSRPLWNAPPSRTIEGQSEAKFASHAWPLAEGSLNMSTVFRSPFKTSWVH